MAKPGKLSKRCILGTAYHEAGHALISWLHGGEIHYLVVPDNLGDIIKLGYAGYCHQAEKTCDALDNLLAGEEAYYLFAGKYSEWQRDFDFSNDADRSRLETGSDYAQAIPLAEELAEQLKAAGLTAPSAADVFEEHRQMVRMRLTYYRQALDALAVALAEKLRLTGEEVEAILEQYIGMR